HRLVHDYLAAKACQPATNMKRQSYTLLELLFAMAIMVILCAVAYPSLEAMYGDFRVTAAVDSVRAAWALGRAHAVNEGQPYRFAVIYNQRDYRLAPESDQGTAGSASTA